MEGVTILNTIMAPSAIIVAIIGVVVLLLGIFMYLKGDEKACGLAAMIMGVIMFTIFGIYSLEREKKIQYEVIVDENVKFNEFMKHYKIIEQHGQIYIVEELDGSSCALVEE